MPLDSQFTQRIEVAKEFLAFNEVIENTIELDSFEIVDNNFEITLSYYSKSKSFNSTANFQVPNVKNYRKIILDSDNKLLKITSKID